MHLPCSRVRRAMPSNCSRQCARFFGRARRRPECRSSPRRFGKFGRSVANIPWTSVDGEAARVCCYVSNRTTSRPRPLLHSPSVFFPAEEMHKCIATDPSSRSPLDENKPRQAFVNKCRHAASESRTQIGFPNLPCFLLLPSIDYYYARRSSLQCTRRESRDRPCLSRGRLNSLVFVRASPARARRPHCSLRRV